MKRCAIILLLCFLCPAFASSPDAPVRVVMDDNYPPYSFRDRNGNLQGILIDQWNEWARVTGSRVELHGMQWISAQFFMSSGQADVIDTIFVTDERRSLYLFEQPYAKIDVPVFVSKNLAGITELRQLRDKPIAVKVGDACIKRLREEGLTNIVEYASYPEIVEKAKRHAVTVFCMDRPPAIYLMGRAGIIDDFSESFILYTGSISRGVHQYDQSLLERMNKGFAKIPPETYADIERRWKGSSPELSVRYRYFLVPVAALSVALVILFFVVWLLRRKVAGKSRELDAHKLRLDTSERMNRAIVRALPDPLFIVTRDGIYVDYSIPESSFFTDIPGGLVGKTLVDVHGPAKADEFRSAIRDVLDHGGVRILECEIAVPSGVRHLECRIVAMDSRRALYTTRDITGRMAHEAAMRKSLAEKEVLLREIHHRVKNNLQVISSLVGMQTDLLRDEIDRRLMNETQRRIQSMALLYELLYRSKDFRSISCAEYFGSILDELVIAYHVPSSRISLIRKFDDVRVNLDSVLPLGLILTELVTNSLKYAFPAAKVGRLEVFLESGVDFVTLTVRDDGIGLPRDVSFEHATSLGFVLVRSLAMQLGGSVTSASGSGMGTSVSVSFHNDPARSGDISVDIPPDFRE